MLGISRECYKDASERGIEEEYVIFSIFLQRRQCIEGLVSVARSPLEPMNFHLSGDLDCGSVS